MLVRTELKALREDSNPQRQAQADLGRILADWRESRAGSGIDRSIRAFATGATLDSLPPLARLFQPGNDAAKRLADDFIGQFMPVLQGNQWGQVPVPHKLDDTSAAIVLASAGNCVLVLTAFDGAALRGRRPAESCSFSPGETYDHVIAGRGTARLVGRGDDGAEDGPLNTIRYELAPGTICSRDSSRQSLLIDAADGTLVTLRLQRRPECGTVAHALRIADGALLHRATANSRESRLELAVALLGKMGRRDAAPLLAAMADERTGQSLRWQSLKQCLGLDTAQGFAALSRLAASEGDDLAAPAQALRAQLIAAHPQLKGIA